MSAGVQFLGCYFTPFHTAKRHSAIVTVLKAEAAAHDA